MLKLIHLLLHIHEFRRVLTLDGCFPDEGVLLGDLLESGGEELESLE